MRKGFAVGLAFVLAMPLGLRAQTDDSGAGAIKTSQTANDSGEKNTAKARAALDAMVKAMGGDAWLNAKNMDARGAYCGVLSRQSRPGDDANSTIFTSGPITIAWSIPNIATWCSFTWAARD